METDTKVVLTRHAAERFAEITCLPDLSREDAYCIIKAMYCSGIKWGADQPNDEFFVRARCITTNTEVIFVVLKRENKRFIKTILRPEHAEANLQIFDFKVSGIQHRPVGRNGRISRTRRRTKNAYKEYIFFEEQGKKRKKQRNINDFEIDESDEYLEHRS